MNIDQESNESASALCISPDVEQAGAALFHQQMWCWGQDIRFPEGNLFLRYGFLCKHPRNGDGGSAYVLTLDEQSSITLWRFGLCYTHVEKGAIFLKRKGFAPRFTLTPEIFEQCWKPADLPDLALPQTEEEERTACQFLSEVCLWASRYEQWIQSTFGQAYRQQCLAAWDETFLPSEQMCAEWERLAALVQTFLPRDKAIQERCQIAPLP
jgi:hypothetical protein